MIRNFKKIKKIKKKLITSLNIKYIMSECIFATLNKTNPLQLNLCVTISEQASLQ